MTGTKTAAVVVTYNRKDKLAKVLDALAAQTQVPDAIYVIDNASTDGTPEMLAARGDARLRHVRLPENVGGAGGFNAGMKAAYADGFDYLWVSDDDAYPEPDALEKLHHAMDDFTARFKWRAPYACSAVRWIDGTWCEMNTPQVVWDWPRWYSADTRYFLVASCSFVSVLIPRWAIAKHGFPIKDYFIWYDDAEYTQRLAKSYPGIFVPDSLAIHDTPENKGVNYGLITAQNLWKFRYGARNETSFRRREQGWVGVFIFARGVWNQMAGARVPWPLRRSILAAIWRGIRFRPAIERP